MLKGVCDLFGDERVVHQQHIFFFRDRACDASGRRSVSGEIDRYAFPEVPFVKGPPFFEKFLFAAAFHKVYRQRVSSCGDRPERGVLQRIGGVRGDRGGESERFRFGGDSA